MRTTAGGQRSEALFRGLQEYIPFNLSYAVSGVCYEIIVGSDGVFDDESLMLEDLIIMIESGGKPRFVITIPSVAVECLVIKVWCCSILSKYYDRGWWHIW